MPSVVHQGRRKFCMGERRRNGNGDKIWHQSASCLPKLKDVSPMPWGGAEATARDLKLLAPLAQH